MEKSSRLPAVVTRILGFLLIAVCLSSHLAARLPARFASGFSGEGGGRVAKFSGGTVFYNVTNMNLEGIRESSMGYYAFAFSFRIEFAAAEVSRRYSLTLHFDDDPGEGTTLLCPSGTVRALDGATPKTATPALLGFSSGSFSAGNAYFSFGVGGESSTLRTAAGTAGSVQLMIDQPLAMQGETHYFKVVFFENIEVNKKGEINAQNEILHILTDIVVEQVD